QALRRADGAAKGTRQPRLQRPDLPSRGAAARRARQHPAHRHRGARRSANAQSRAAPGAPDPPRAEQEVRAMSDRFDLKGKTPESWACIDCGINTAPGVPGRVEMERRYNTAAVMQKLARAEPSSM